MENGQFKQGRPGRTARSQPASRNTAGPHGPQPLPLFKVILVAIAILALVFVARMCTSAATIDVTVNGTPLTLHGAKTLQTAVDESGLPINPGDLISLRGTVLERHAGHTFAATVNGEPTTDGDMRLHGGDTITITDGDDIVEDYEVSVEPIAYEGDTVGMGALHIFTDGNDGVMEVHTGVISGDVTRSVKLDPIPITRHCYNPDVGDTNSIALTFDDGPSQECTEDILDILAENDAKATFFCVGSEIVSDEDTRIVNRIQDEGHQLASHTYSYAHSIGDFNFSKITAEEQVKEIEGGFDALEKATGVAPSRVVRLPGGDMDNVGVYNLASHLVAEVGWTLDTGDWILPGADAIYDILMSAKPGDIVLCHDDANSSQTVEALKKALPKLREKGYEFVTIDTMLTYPAEEYW